MREMGVSRLAVDNYELEIFPFKPGDQQVRSAQGDTTLDPYEALFQGHLPKIR